MDVRNDLYCCLTPQHTQVLRDLLEEEPEQDIGSLPDPAEDGKRLDGTGGRTSPLLAALLQRGILVTSQGEGKSLLESQGHSTNITELLVPDENRRTPSVLQTARFMHAGFLASRQLGTQGLSHTIASIAQTNRYSRAESSADLAHVAQLLATFQCLRPYYPRPYLCLFDSLALVYFLLRQGVRPEWVFGVKVAPFGAHCWVQVDSVLVNDTLDNVRAYVPIMRV